MRRRTLPSPAAALHVDDELHAPGSDVEQPRGAGVTISLERLADETGLFGAETHETELEPLLLELR